MICWNQTQASVDNAQGVVTALSMTRVCVLRHQAAVVFSGCSARRRHRIVYDTSMCAATPAFHSKPSNGLVSVTREDRIFGKNYNIVVVVIVVGDPINMLTVEAPGHRDVLVVLVLISLLFVA